MNSKQEHTLTLTGQRLLVTLSPDRRISITRVHGPSAIYEDRWAIDDPLDELLEASEALTTLLRTIVQDLDHRAPTATTPAPSPTSDPA